MEERCITESDVINALNRRIGDPLPGKSGTIVIRGHASGGRIIRIVLGAHDKNNIITVFEE